MRKSALALALVGLFGFAAPAFASDHLADAVDATGHNPVGGNPSGVSGGAAAPGSVPGEGNPNNEVGDDGSGLGAPSVDRGLIDDRSGGHGRGDR